MSARVRTVAAGLVLAAVVGVLVQRAASRANQAGRLDPARWALQDFRDAVYYPVVAFLDGRNPYDQDAQARTYPVGQSFPLYLPLTLVAHLPFGLLPHAKAGALYFIVTIALTTAVAWLAIGGAGVPASAAGVLALEDLVRGPGRDPAQSPVVQRLAAPAVHPAGPAFMLANQPLGTLEVLAFLQADYVLACDLGDRFLALRVLPKRYDHGWPRYLYRSRNQPVDTASLRRLCATS